RIVGGAVGPFGGLIVSERHIARAEPVELAERRQRTADLPSALDADHRGYLTLAMNPDHVVGSKGALEVIGIGGDHPIDDVDLLDCAADRLVAGKRPVDIDRPELAAEPAGVE